MDVVDFIRRFFFELSKQLEASDLYLAIFAALLGAVVGALLTMLVSILSGFFNKLSYNKLVREGANKRGNSSRLTQSFHFFMFEPI
ncbi:hypothetical protein, partial [Aeromonas rivipollensis]|uniref:hypothetical protein n=1 Tax=Aeromonas rivipollensis TaxID=948519 RepID=UPI003D01C336